MKTFAVRWDCLYGVIGLTMSSGAYVLGVMGTVMASVRVDGG